MSKNSTIPLFLIFLFATLLLSSCEVVEAIFKTGVGIGIFIAVVILVIGALVFGVLRGKK